MTGKEVKSKRRALKLTQKQLAEKTGLNRIDISYHGRTKRDLRNVNSYHNMILEGFFKGANNEKNG
ncbi:MAG: helix-turn-helix domain-containing protein [Bacteroidales bacterium]|nr:helix-turn-helix domain-containing protein [Bacteroidales bacterium]